MYFMYESYEAHSPGPDLSRVHPPARSPYMSLLSADAVAYIGVRGFPTRGYFIPGRDGGGGLVAGKSSVSSSRDQARARARPYLGALSRYFLICSAIF